MPARKVSPRKIGLGTERYTISKVLALIVFFVALTVIIGWFTNIPLLTSILPIWVSMKFSTAVSFIFSALLLYSFATAQKKKKHVSSCIFFISIAIILFFMGTLFISTILGITSGVETLFVQEQSGSVRTVYPGLPSVPTMFCFIVISLLGIIILLKPKSWKLLLSFGSTTLFFVGTIALMGYILDLPLLYYSIPGVNTAMAIHTAILFILLSIGFYLSGVHESFIESCFA